jgi:hypothetical protein
MELASPQYNGARHQKFTIGAQNLKSQPVFPAGAAKDAAQTGAPPMKVPWHLSTTRGSEPHRRAHDHQVYLVASAKPWPMPWPVGVGVDEGACCHPCVVGGPHGADLEVLRTSCRHFGLQLCQWLPHFLCQHHQSRMSGTAGKGRHEALGGAARGRHQTPTATKARLSKPAANSLAPAQA